MYVCMYVCMYVYMYVSMYVRTYVCLYIHMYVCMYVCMYAPPRRQDIATSDSIFLRQAPAVDAKDARTVLRRLQVPTYLTYLHTYIHT